LRILSSLHQWYGLGSHIKIQGMDRHDGWQQIDVIYRA